MIINLISFFEIIVQFFAHHLKKNLFLSLPFVHVLTIFFHFQDLQFFFVYFVYVTNFIWT
jgi:hypothetical protein